MMSLKTFKDHYLDSILDFLWNQWSIVGVPGQAEGNDTRIVDPEALIIFTCAFGRYDSRLFDEMLGWMRLHERLINVQRLKCILSKERFIGEAVLCAVASFTATPKTMTKWRRLERTGANPGGEQAPLFFQKNGAPLPLTGSFDPVFASHGFKRDPVDIRNHIQLFRPERTENLLLRLRALFGVNSRCEVLAYLLTHERANAPEISRSCYYYQRTVYNVLAEMHLSGLVHLWEKGPEKLYGLKVDRWKNFLSPRQPLPVWTTWPPLCSALERIWSKLADADLEGMGSRLLASEFRILMRDIQPALELSGCPVRLSSHDARLRGADYVSACLEVFEALVEMLRQPVSK
ncbi:MAG: hypothetical protein AB1486_16105 [Planctomycetota bacterium]